MITLDHLPPHQYRQVAEWEHGAQPEHTDWDLHAREMADPRCERYGLYLDGQLVGSVALEKLSRKVVAFHIATKRHTFRPNDLAGILLKIGGRLFEKGVLACVAHAPIKKREVARLAIRCGMKEYGRSASTRCFILTKQRYIKNAQFQAQADADALPADDHLRAAVDR